MANMLCTIYSNINSIIITNISASLPQAQSAAETKRAISMICE